MLKNKTYTNKLIKQGYVFIKINKKTKEFQQEILRIIDTERRKHRINLEETTDKKLHKFTLKLQKKINKKFHPIYFFKKNSELINEIFGKTKLSLQHYFYLRIVKPKRNSLISPINFHRETFYNEPFFKFAYNFWLPINNYEKNNSMFYYKNSHKFKIKKDFDITDKKTNIKKRSSSHKIGYLYNEKQIRLKKKIKPLRLYKKNCMIIFSGELMHGNGINLTKKVRISLDIRFIKKKHVKVNAKQSSSNKKYFKDLVI